MKTTSSPVETAKPIRAKHDAPVLPSGPTRRAAESGEVTGSLSWLRTELADYWSRHAALALVLRYLTGIETEHWHEDATAARVVAGAGEDDHV